MPFIDSLPRIACHPFQRFGHLFPERFPVYSIRNVPSRTMIRSAWATAASMAHAEKGRALSPPSSRSLARISDRGYLPGLWRCFRP